MAYPITQEVLDLFTTQHRQIVDIAFNGVAETKTLTEKDVIQGGLSIDRYCVSGSRIEIGSAVAAELSLTLDNTDGKFNDTAFEGAELFINVGTKKWEARKWEKAVEHFIPMGYFTVDNSPRKLSHITLSALDRMVHFDKDVEPEKLSFPMTVGNLLEQICNICNVELATDILTLINQDYVINEYPQGDDLIYRQLLMWIAEITGTCAYIDWEGKLRLEWYKTESSARIDAAMRFSSDLLENALTISGVRIKVSDEENILCGDESYALLIEGNGLIQHDSEALAQNIYSKVGGFTYTPYECIAKPFVNLYPLDSIVFVDKDGVEVPTVVTNTTFLINGNIGISAKGETATNDGYASANPLTKQEAVIIEKVKKEANKNLSESVQSILSFNELISNALGIYATVVTDKSGGKQYYMHDSPNLEDSNTIYTLNTGGFAYTNSGWNNGNPVWQYGFDKNGNAIYKKVCAYGMEVSNPNGSYSATISPDAFKIWQNAVLLLDASKEGLKIFNGGITIFKGVGSYAKKAMYFDSEGNIAIDGYLTQLGSKYKALIGSNEQGYGGFYIYNQNSNYLRNDGTYKPYFEVWSSTNNHTYIEGTNELKLGVSTIADEDEGNYAHLSITPDGAETYGIWNINGALNIYNAVKVHNNMLQFWYDDGNAESGFIGTGTWGDKKILLLKSDGVPLYMTYADDSGNDGAHIVLEGSKGTLYGTFDFNQEQKFSHTINAPAFICRSGSSKVMSLYISTGNNPCFNSDNGKDYFFSVDGDVRLAVRSTGGDMYGIWNINGALNIYNAVKVHNNMLQFWYDDGNAESGFIGTGTWGDKKILLLKSDGVPLYMTYADDSGNDGAHIVLEGSKGTLYGTFDFNQEQKFSHTINAPAFICRSGSSKVMSLYISTGNNPCFNSDNGKDYFFSVDGDVRLAVRSTGGDMYGKWGIHTDSGYASLITDQTGTGGGKLWGTWYLGNSTAITSDENKKNSIEELPEKYSALFDNLRPVRYKYNDGTSDRFHTGFIAQEVEQALTNSEIDSQEFAGFVKNEDGECFLRYEEFIALAINEVQTLKKKNSDLEQRVADLESKLETILSKLGGETNGGDN